MKDKFIVLTHEFIRDNSLTMNEKIVYLEILNLSSLEKGCIASNSHFEKSFGISKKSVSNTISSLVKKGFIESKLSDRNHTRILSIKNGHLSTNYGQLSTKNGETKDNKTTNKTINTDSGIIERFDKIWKAYKIPAKSKGVKSDALNSYKRKGIHKKSDKEIKIVLYAEMKKTYGQRHLTTIFNNFDGSLEMANEILNENSQHEQKEVLV